MKDLKTVLGIVLLAVIYGCSDAEIQPKKYPFVITNEVTDINASGVTFSAEIVPGTNHYVIIDYGFIWSSESVYTHSFAGSENVSDQFSFRVTSDLIKNKLYSCRAYVITRDLTIYGNRVWFTAH